MSSILVRESGGIRTITLNRPERRNALTPEMQDELIAALNEAAASPTTRVVMLTGTGESFCSGLDLSALKSMQHKSTAQLDADAQRIALMFQTLYALPIPTIAAVKGYALAGGTGLATLCDFTLADTSAKFGYTEVRIGFVPALVSAYLVMQIGEKRARDLLLTARLFSAEEGFRLGLVTEVLAPADLAGRTQALAESLLSNAPASLIATKKLIQKQNQAWLEAALSAALEVNVSIRREPDFREGLTAFLEKRPPQWSR